MLVREYMRKTDEQNNSCVVEEKGVCGIISHIKRHHNITKCTRKLIQQWRQILLKCVHIL